MLRIMPRINNVTKSVKNMLRFRIKRIHSYFSFKYTIACR